MSSTPTLKTLLICFYDIRGFTRLVDATTTDVDTFQLLDEMAKEAEHRVEASGGEVVKFIGDAALIIFPEDRIDEGVRALLELKDALQQILADRGKKAEVLFAPCHCITSKQHQTLDEKGYLYAAARYSVQVISSETGKLVGEFGSYGNMDCRGPSSKYPHPELPLGTISALSVWKDRLYVVDVLNRRIAKCRIVYDPMKREASLDPKDR